MFRQNIAIQEVPSDWVRVPSTGSGAERSKTPILSRPRKPPWKTLRPDGSLRFTHQVKLSRSLTNTRSRKAAVAVAAVVPLVHLVNPQRGPGVHRRVDVAEIPFVGRHLAVRVHVPDLAQQDQLILGEPGIDERQGHQVKGPVPGGEPGVFPLVRHGDDIGSVEMEPIVVPAGLAAFWTAPAGRDHRPATP